jgi:hypothetical protein
MSNVVTNVIEAAVGAACVVAAIGARRRSGLHLVAAFLAAAGLAALVHAAVSLT